MLDKLNPGKSLAIGEFITSLKRTFWPIFDRILPWITMGWISFYLYSFFVLLPYSGFFFLGDPADGQVYDAVQSPLNTDGHITGISRGGWMVLESVDGVTQKMLAQDLTLGFFNSARNNQTVELMAAYNVFLANPTQPTAIPYTLPGYTLKELYWRLASPWFLSLIFWLAGYASLLYLRPHGPLTRLLALFYFLNAAWLATSLVSGWRFMGSALVLRVLIWLLVPVSLHLHWLFPRPLRQLPNWAWGSLYAFCAAIAGASVFQLLPQNFIWAGISAAALGNLILLIVHARCHAFSPGPLRGGLLLVLVLAGASVPWVLPLLIMIGNLLGHTSSAQGPLPLDLLLLFVITIMIMGAVVWPELYFANLYLLQVTLAQIHQAARQVRLAFLVAFSTLFLALVLLFYNRQNLTGSLLLLSVVIFILFLFNGFLYLALPTLAFEHLNPRRLGSAAGQLASHTTHTPPDVEPEVLTGQLLNEVLPGLGVEQWVHLEWRRDALVPRGSLGGEPDDLPATDARPVLEWASGVYLPPGGSFLLPGWVEFVLPQFGKTRRGLPDWVRLILPLRAEGQLRGFWLLGQLAGDKNYTFERIAGLQALADQTALALLSSPQPKIE